MGTTDTTEWEVQCLEKCLRCILKEQVRSNELYFFLVRIIIRFRHQENTLMTMHLCMSTRHLTNIFHDKLADNRKVWNQLLMTSNLNPT